MTRVVVVGAGVLGASAAFHLARGGASVTLVEAVAPGAGTSSRGAGLVCEGLWHPTSVALAQRSIELLGRLSKEGEEGNHPFRLYQVGSTTLVPERLVETARRLARFQASLGVDVKELSPDDAVALPRHAGMDMHGVALALHYARDGWGLPRLYSEIVAFVAREMGARVIRGAARLVVKDGTARAEVDGERLESDAVVVACGIHTRALLQGAGLDAPLLAYRTQAARVVHPRAGEVPILHDVAQGSYLRPAWPGQLVAGNGTTTTPEDPQQWRAEADETFIDATTARVRRRFPHLADARVDDAWAGLDAATPDRFLLAGPHPDQDDVWLLAGGNGHGFMRAPAAGESLAAMLLGKAPRVDLTPFSPARFGQDITHFEIQEGYSIEVPSLL